MAHSWFLCRIAHEGNCKCLNLGDIVVLISHIFNSYSILHNTVASFPCLSSKSNQLSFRRFYCSYLPGNLLIPDLYHKLLPCWKLFKDILVSCLSAFMVSGDRLREPTNFQLNNFYLAIWDETSCSKMAGGRKIFNC